MGKFIENIYRTKVFARCDDKGTAYYFSAKDFNGLNAVPYSFVSSKGDTLKGNFYYYDNPITFTALSGRPTRKSPKPPPATFTSTSTLTALMPTIAPAKHFTNIVLCFYRFASVL